MRFFSSSALASAEKLRLAANCSAAEAMRSIPGCAARRACPLFGPLYRDQADFSPPLSPPLGAAPLAAAPFSAPFSPLLGLGGASTLTEPPAFSTAATADFEAP